MEETDQDLTTAYDAPLKSDRIDETTGVTG
jgi:hypothetical protein